MAPTFDQVFPILYKGWDRTAAQADFNAGNWRNKAGADQFLGGANQSPDQSANNVIQSSIDTWKSLVTETAKKFTDYQQSNPFVVDEVLKQKQGLAKEQLDPYYNETLGNYLLGTQRKLERGAQDTHDLLSELSGQTQNYTQDTQLKLDNAISSAREGYANSGLYDSGSRLRSEGLLGVQSDLASNNFLSGQNYRANQATLGQSRLQQDYGLGSLSGQNLKDVSGLNLADIPGVGTETANQIRDLQRQRTVGETDLASSLTKEAGQKYVTGFQASLPPEYQSGNMDLLKQIGIYT